MTLSKYQYQATESPISASLAIYKVLFMYITLCNPHNNDKIDISHYKMLGNWSLLRFKNFVQVSETYT